MSILFIYFYGTVSIFMYLKYLKSNLREKQLSEVFSISDKLSSYHWYYSSVFKNRIVYLEAQGGRTYVLGKDQKLKKCAFLQNILINLIFCFLLFLWQRNALFKA